MELRSLEGMGRERLVRQAAVALQGTEAWVTGGYVRDWALGRPSADLDLSAVGDADALAPAARALGAGLGRRPHLLGRPPRAVWRIETDELTVELWPLGTLSLDEDAHRRDFTCNALLWRLPDGPLVDRVRGWDDLARGRLRAVHRGNLERDPVRCVRGARFLAELDRFDLDPSTRRWIGELAPIVARAPRERVGAELGKLLSAPGITRGLVALLSLHLLGPAAPPAARPDEDWLRDNLAAATLLAHPRRHPVSGAARVAGPKARLGLLLSAWGVDSAAEIAPYAWPRSDRDDALAARHQAPLLLHDRDAPAADLRERIHDAGRAFPAVLALAAALDPGPSWRRWWRLWRRRGEALLETRPLLPAEEVASLCRLSQGPKLGEALRALVHAQVRGDVRTAEGARRWLRRRSGALANCTET